jgi:hypothetical protein
LLLNGLIAIAFPVAACGLFMVISREAFSLHAWKKLHLLFAACVCIVIAAPWHVLAMLRNPPWFAFSMHSGPGEYRGFFWFYFFNEHLLRFLNLRYPRDYNTVPRIWFWLLNLVWLFPWSVYLPGAFKLTYLGPTRAARVRLMALCWIAVVMVFFTFSTTQEYYAMPIYPALALLLACSLRDEGVFNRTSSFLLAALMAFIATTLAVLLLMVWRLPASGDIVQALNQHPELYTLSLGHMGDLTLRSFAYLRLPLFVAALCYGLCAIGIVLSRPSVQKTVAVVSICMVFFFQAARLALVRFDSYLSSYPLARALQQAPPGELIEMDGYYAFSSVFFYADRRALLLHGRINNLEYGSNAPEAPHVFIDDQQFEKLWHGSKRCYLLTYAAEAPKLQSLGGTVILVAENSGAELFTNLAMP